MNDIKISSNRNFGIVFFIFFFIISFYPLINQNKINFWFLTLSLIFLILGIQNSKILTPLNKIWFKFGVLLGNLISPLVMFMIFFFIVTPIGIVMRAINKDLLNLKFNKTKSYWIKKKEINSKMKNQF